MKAILPGQPEASLQALSTGHWDGAGGRRIVVYITGNALAILSDDTIIQTIYDDDERKLEAVAFDELSGKIAASTGRTVRIYKPLGQLDDALKWGLQSSFDIDEANTSASLSWGSSEELLVGRNALWLYDTTSNPASCYWHAELPSPVRSATLSYDSAYIASVGYHDRMVKVWRRLNFGFESHFDFGYLPHPRAVARIEWRRPVHFDQTIENVLYTFCADNMMRVWTGADGHGCQFLRLWGEVDLATAIQDDTRNRSADPDIRWAFIIGQRDLATATEKAVGGREAGLVKDDVRLQYLISIANRDTEICVIMDGRGNMAAYALENVCTKSQSANNIDTVTLVKSKDFDLLGRSGDLQHVAIYNYCNKTSGQLNVLFHHFDGRVEVFESNITDLLDPTSKPRRLIPRATWSGHSASIKKIVRNFSGRAIVSRTEQGESLVWRHASNQSGSKLVRHNAIPESRHIHRICLLRGGKFVVFLHHNAICVWDCQQNKPSLLAESKYDIPGKPLCVLVLPRKNAKDVSVAHIATITSEQRGIVWELRLPIRSRNEVKLPINGHKPGACSIREFCSFNLDDAGDLAYVLPVDPAGSSPVISGFLDVFARDVAVSYTHSGRVEFWTARVSSDRDRVEWLSTASLETGIAEPALVSGSTMKKAALVNASRSEVTIWDVRGAQLEFSRDFESHNTVQDLDWTSTPDSQSILAVGFQYRVVLLAQMRFDYLNKGPAWATIREISIRDFTPHPIGDSTWLSGGNLVIGAGNQLFMYDRMFETPHSFAISSRLPHRKDGTRDLFEVVQRLNGPLPIFHPQFLSQCMLSGKNTLVQRVLLALNHTLKYHVEGETIDDYLGLDLAEFYIGSSIAATTNGSDSYLVQRASYDDADEAFSEDTAVNVCEKLQKIALPQLSSHEQIQLLDIVECVGVVERQRRSMDENGARFMLFFRQHALRKGRTNEIHMSWREINWAYHSTSQDILTDFVSRQYHGTLLWENARESGVFMWLTDAAAVKAQFEIVARNEYAKSDVKNPVDCSLFYFALKKKAVLQGLWRMAHGNREQVATQRLLSNNFEDPKWRTTALKNAYALLSKRRFAYAAAFFLLADHLQDAVNVCLNQIKDLQLAIAITRVYEGDNGPILRKLLEDEVLAVAAREGNRWLASWAFWMLRRRDMAVRSLITPVYTLLETPYPSDLKSKLFLTDDPALVVLYSQLRQKTLQTLRGASKVTPKVEWDFVLHNARLYDRMGCDLLGLDLVRNWEFLRAPVAPPGLGGEIDLPKLLRRRSSLVVADMPLSPIGAEMKTGGGGWPGIGTGNSKAQQTPTVFEEPDAGSLLDSFGF
ncbi:RAVE protein 1 C terminal-domain-containing protein [Pseudomassariella vexata]|uniref:RAVE protein 1 C terminal-domain-containing protein n=1 Tax=Pseudomassariella vexata TaxID=1141098 RepID=A0A1Y2DXE8_9PEZI|nr:RAVE protein 1 C terminal-domain-containing protein [Pseudomassariella vexata]ORY63968.1 RAVE protein 1 C terminal-domain-containing protein [Pseudomassariella vexata]